MKNKTPLFAVLAIVMVTFGLFNPILTFDGANVAHAAAPGFGSPAFQKTWLHADGPVDTGAAQRSYLWGPTALATVHEFYQDAPGQTRLVEYFDKTRMELNNPYSDPNSPYYVSNGLLVVELISGNMQVGNNTFQNRGSADFVPIAGDPNNQGQNPNAPTYASFLHHASLDPATDTANKATTAVGSTVTATIDRAGNIGSTQAFTSDSNTKIAFYDQNLGHNIPAAFWTYLNQTGLTENADGTRSTGKVFDWYSAMGFPITEAYWTKATVAGKQNVDVLVQAFQRRVLTYTPSNPANFKVEMGNVGQHYLEWRYGGSTPVDHKPSYPLSVPNLGFGINADVYYQDKAQITGWVDDLGVRWVREQITWKDIEGPTPGNYAWGELDSIVNTLYADNIHIILSPVGAPTFYAPNGGMPDDTNAFGNFMYALASHYKGKVDAYEMWNEENLAKEAGPQNSVQDSVAKYGQMLKHGYNGVKAGDPYAFVILGALTPTGVNDPKVAINDVDYLKALYAYNGGELKQYYDVLGAHPGSNNNPPNTLWPSNPGPGTGPSNYTDPCVAAKTCWQQDPSFYFRRIEQLRQVMVDNGEGNKQMWLTEFGWDSTEGSGVSAPNGYQYADVISEQQQADYIQGAYQLAQSNYPWMGVMALWNLNFALPSVTTNANDEKVGWGILRRDGTKRPSYFVEQQFARAAK